MDDGERFFAKLGAESISLWIVKRSHRQCLAMELPTSALLVAATCLPLVQTSVPLLREGGRRGFGTEPGVEPL